jgi:hypothetical protein
MRRSLSIVGLLLVLVTRGTASGAASGPFATNQRIVYSDGLHSENTEMIRLGKRILLMFRGGEEGQIGSARARLEIFESRDRGKTFTLLSEVNASGLPGDRDIRDPKFVQMGDKLFLYAISRLPGFHYRDLGGEAWTVRSESSDGGRTWTAPVKTYADGTVDDETFWGFWRFTSRRYKESGKRKRTLYATGYTDFDTAVGFFASDDGITWEKRSTIIDSYDDVPSEAELQFFGKNAETAVALIRLDNQDILADGQTAICTAHDPFTTWECGRRIEQRLDGPTWVVRGGRGRPRSFVFARKHLPCTFKRTAIYELRGDLHDPSAPIEVCEIQELESSGDTAYTSLAPLDKNRSLLAWYSSKVDQELAWFEGISSPSDIWLAEVDFRRAPKACTPPPVERSCPQPPVPSGTTSFDVTGSQLLTLAPVIWPAQTLTFRADVVVHGGSLDLALQPLDDLTKVPVGVPWTVMNVALSASGEFVADFGTQAVPAEAYRLLNDPFLTVQEFVLHGVTTSSDGFCGSIAGFGQVYGTKPSDRIRLEGSTFGAARIVNDTLPAPVSACPAS